MKALSVKQPWAGYITVDQKLIETRTWATNYRGEILICSSLKPDNSIPFNLWPSKKFSTLGVAMCLVDLVDCVPLEPKHESFAMCEAYDGYAWILENIRPVKQIPIKGQLRIFNVPDEAIKKLIF